jgi:hypothetical protein
VTQIGFPPDKAHEALDDFLTGERCERWIGPMDGGKTIAYIVPGEAWETVRSGYAHWLDSQEVHDLDADLPPGYRPFHASPLDRYGLPNRLLPHEPFHEPIARYAFGKPYTELDETERHKVEGAAIMCVLRTTLDPDGNGAVPILMIGHEPDEPGPALRWQIACVTSVHGLYLRTTPAMFGDEWAIVTGSGYRLASGWYSKDDAAATVEALGRTLPGLDWMRITSAGFTPKARQAIKAVLARYHYYGVQEDKPEPEVMTDVMPADDAAPGELAPAGEAQERT